MRLRRALIGLAAFAALVSAPAGSGSNGRPVLEIVFHGSGTAKLTSTSPQVLNAKQAMVTMAWTLRWHTDLGAPKSDDYLSEPLKASDISGAASLTLYPAFGKSCSGHVKANTTRYGREGWSLVQGKTALPVPLELGSSAITCYSPGGGTQWFAVRDAGANQAENDRIDRSIFALLPVALPQIPKNGRYRRSGNVVKTVRSSAGSRTVTLHWTGYVDILVNGNGPKQGGP